jgi:hypothetical protein
MQVFEFTFKIVGAFIERINLTKDFIHCDVPVRWPDDVIGEWIDPEKSLPIWSI